MPVSVNDPITPIQNIFNRIENERQLFTYRWANAAARTGQTGMVSGAIGYQVDTGVYWMYTGTAWTQLLGDTGWVNAVLTGGWTAQKVVQYRRLNNVVYIRGRVTGGSGAIFNLPVGFRPFSDNSMVISVAANTAGTTVTRIVVQLNGNVEGLSGATPSLDSINFPADA